MGPVALVGALVLAVLLLALATGSDAGASAAPRATAASTTCDISRDSRRLGPTYVTSLKVTGVRCSSGKSVVRAFHSCRLANGVRGRCVRAVLGYACVETRSGIETQFSGRVTCRKGRRKTVAHTYTQFT